MQIILNLLANLLSVGQASELVVELQDNSIDISCVETDSLDGTLIVFPTNEREQVFLSNGHWVLARIDGSVLHVREYDGEAGASIVRHLWAISGYQGDGEIVFFHARTRGENFIYWREFTTQNSFQHGLIGFNGVNLMPICSENRLLQSRSDLGELD